jgi:hypothetical protein
MAWEKKFMLQAELRKFLGIFDDFVVVSVTF